MRAYDSVADVRALLARYLSLHNCESPARALTGVRLMRLTLIGAPSRWPYEVPVAEFGGQRRSDDSNPVEIHLLFAGTSSDNQGHLSGEL